MYCNSMAPCEPPPSTPNIARTCCLLLKQDVDGDKPLRVSTGSKHPPSRSRRNWSPSRTRRSVSPSHRRSIDRSLSPDPKVGGVVCRWYASRRGVVWWGALELGTDLPVRPCAVELFLDLKYTLSVSLYSVLFWGFHVCLPPPLVQTQWGGGGVYGSVKVGTSGKYILTQPVRLVLPFRHRSG